MLEVVVVWFGGCVSLVERLSLFARSFSAKKFFPPSRLVLRPNLRGEGLGSNVLEERAGRRHGATSHCRDRDGSDEDGRNG